MHTILHGDDTVAIHGSLVSILSSAKAKGKEIIRIDAKGVTISDLENAIGTQELFATEKVVVIDKLHSLAKSKMKDTLIAWIAQRNDPLTDIVLLEEKILTPTQLKAFTQAKVVLCKLPQLLFTFVEHIGVLPGLKLITQFHEILNTQDAEFVFAMLVRQIRILLQYVSDGTFSGPPFAKSKLQKQASAFTLEKLLRLHGQLLAIDYGQKTSRSVLTLSQEIDLFLSKL